MDPDLPASKSDYLETPNMARLMEGGIRFTSGYSPAPLCTPTRCSILCGTSAARSGPTGALYFHRPGKKESTIREGIHKLRIVWNNDVTVAGREFYQVDPNPTEEGHNIAASHPEKADFLQKNYSITWPRSMRKL